MKWTNKGHEFDEVAKEILDENAKYYLWGAGVYGTNFYEDFKDKINILGIVDSNKQGQIINDIKIQSPDIIEKKENIKVILTCSWKSTIYPILEEKGFQHNKNFFHYYDYTFIYGIYKENKLNIPSLGYQITQKCTLRCKYCMALMPYIKKPQNFDVDKIISDFDNLFKIVDNVNTVTLGGGDALVHPEINDIITKLCEKYYGNKINKVVILTNAIIMPSHETLDIAKIYDITFRFTDYANKRQKIQELIDILCKNVLNYDYLKYSNWVDLGYNQETKTGRNLPVFFEKCDNIVCNGLYDNKVFNCSVILAPNATEQCKFNEDDYFDLFKNNNKIELMEFLLGYTTKGYLEYCKYCNGNYNVNKKEIPAGEQL